MGSCGTGSGWGWILPVGIGTLILYFLVWAALHDIARQESGSTLEWIVLAMCVPAFALVYRVALSRLVPGERTLWLLGVTVLTALASLGAGSSLLRPKYPGDPLAATVFLAAGAPLLAVLVGRLLVDSRQRRNAPRTHAR
jgi:hypothetical protein